jgi:hypothetical protein
MKKALFAIFAICLLQAGLLGCDSTTITDYYIHTLEPFYTNNSGVAVNLTIRGYCEKEGYYPFHCTQKIENNNTLCNYYMEGHSCAASDWQIPSVRKDSCDFIKESGPCKEPMYFKIEFLSEPKVCLVFDGNARVGENDIRYWKDYTFTEKVSVGDSYLYYYYYYITPELREQASAEYCQ